LLSAFTFAVPTTSHCDPIASPILWRSLSHVQRAVGVSNYVWDGDSLCLSNGVHQLRFFAGRRKSDINGTTVWLNAAPDGSAQAGDWRLSSSDLDLLLLSVLPQDEGAPKRLHVMLDPGHGGEDDGACSPAFDVKEKHLTLAMSHRIAERLTAAGMRVSFTRTNDTALALDERSRLARTARADLFVSIHANYASNTNANGVETYVLPLTGYPGTAEGSGVRGRQTGNNNDFHNALLGYAVHRNLARLEGSPDRGLKRQAFYVLRETKCPAVLIEIGFLSSPANMRYLLDDDWQSACAAAVADGVVTYSRRVANLDAALAAKRARDENARHRRVQRLAQSAAAQPPNASLPSTPATNTPVAEIGSLFDFYATGTGDNP